MGGRGGRSVHAQQPAGAQRGAASLPREQRERAHRACLRQHTREAGHAVRRRGPQHIQAGRAPLAQDLPRQRPQVPGQEVRAHRSVQGVPGSDLGPRSPGLQVPRVQDHGAQAMPQVHKSALRRRASSAAAAHRAQ